ncbi:Ig-like domain-containing protein [Lentilactobacillus buchneri]|uniref:Ig-like domain-containing protein n=1 Tax=Lentilactobacillus buchneri TaxID=1581 RepID=UPI0011EC5C72|nr:Ig-like domain-containing protein [Lentilactobacillus buchneri]
MVKTANIYQGDKLVGTGNENENIHVKLGPKEYLEGAFTGEMIDENGIKSERVKLPAVTVPVPTVAVTKVAIDPATASVEVGKTVTLKEVITPDNATEKGVNWSITDTGIATVSAGVVTGKAAGKTTLTATSKADGKITGTAEITVTAPAG